MGRVVSKQKRCLSSSKNVSTVKAKKNVPPQLNEAEHFLFNLLLTKFFD